MRTRCLSTAGTLCYVSALGLRFATFEQLGSCLISLLHLSLALCGMRFATTLRLVSKQVKDKVEEFPWEDMERVLVAQIPRWRRCFPMARTLNISGNRLRNAKGVWPASHFRGMESVTTLCIQNSNFRGENFKHFPNLRVLVCGENPMVMNYDGLKNLRVLKVWGEAFPALIDERSLPLLEELDIVMAFSFVVSSLQADQGCAWMARLKKFRQQFMLEYIQSPGFQPRARRIKVVVSPEQREWRSALSPGHFRSVRDQEWY